MSGSKTQLSPNRVVQLDHVYDLLRDCMLNQLYYGHRLSHIGSIAFWLDVVVVIGSATSGVSGWIIWTTYPPLKGVWAVIAGGATLIAALKPVLHTDAQVKRYSALFSSYRQLALCMRAVVDGIHEAQGLGADGEREVKRVKTRYRDLSTQDDPNPSRKLIMRLQAEVNTMVPTSSLFYPRSRPTADPPADEWASAGETMGRDGKVEAAEPWPKKV